MAIPFIIGIIIIAIASSIIAYTSYAQIVARAESDVCIENWFRDILCITTITITTITTIVTGIISVVPHMKHIPLYVPSTLLLCYCSWDLLTRAGKISERKTVTMLIWILAFLIILLYMSHKP